ncbi:MAG: phage minor tail protein L [Methylotetracoccus sp.]
MSIWRDVQMLGAGALITLFEIDLTPIGAAQHYWFHGGVNEKRLPVVWKGVTYNGMRIAAEGFEWTSRGVLPRPKIQVVNPAGILSALCIEHDDLVGAKVVRRRTMAKYLDAVNFESGNPDADPNEAYPDEIWIVDQKTAETKFLVEWELTSVFDLAGVLLPNRLILEDHCQWEYRGADGNCGYIRNPAMYGTANPGGIFDAFDNVVSDPALDVCGKKVSSCRLRQGGTIRTGAFPGCSQISQ